MAYYFPEGSSQQYSKTFAAAKTITAVAYDNTGRWAASNALSYSM